MGTRMNTYNDPVPDKDMLRTCLSDGFPREEICKQAEEICCRICGRGVLVRGIVEFSSYCRNTCLYCGLRSANTHLRRYRMSGEQVLAAVKLVHDHGIRTVVLQSGEDPSLSPEWLARLVGQIKTRFDMAVTLSVGEWPRGYYKMWREAGADRFLLKIETTDEALYTRLHPGMSYKNRLLCLNQLFELGYQTGSGIISGLPGQTIGSIASDILFLHKHDFDMISIGPFIPHPATPLGQYPRGTVDLACRALALTRILTRDAHMPATTALGAGKHDLRSHGLLAGANVIMPNFTPSCCAELYDIYPHSPREGNGDQEELARAAFAAEAAGRSLDFSRGDSLKKIYTAEKEHSYD